MPTSNSSTDFRTRLDARTSGIADDRFENIRDAAEVFFASVQTNVEAKFSNLRVREAILGTFMSDLLSKLDTLSTEFR